MKIYHSIEEFIPNTKNVITLGTFDGVHIGHRQILSRVTENARKNHAESVVLTFYPHPRIVLQQDQGLRLLNTLEEKIQLIEACGVDHLIIHPFSTEFANLSAEDFVKQILVDQLKICSIIIGYDHRFGKNRTANIHDLVAFGERYNFEVTQISAEEINEISISSTKIRQALDKGDISLANSYLTTPYSIKGTVIQGKQLGRTIGFPTANIQVDYPYKLIPAEGVYIVRVLINNQFHWGMMNIGTNPTVSGQNLSLEVHLLDFNSDIYHQSIEIQFLKRLRDEIAFNTLQALKEQLYDDKKNTYDYIQTTFV